MLPLLAGAALQPRIFQATEKRCLSARSEQGATAVSHPQGSGLTRSHTFGARRRFIHFVKDSSRIYKKRFSCGAYFHAARKALKKFKTQFIFQILNLA